MTDEKIEVADLEHVDAVNGEVEVNHHGLEKPDADVTLFNTARSIDSVGTEEEPAFLVNNAVKIYNFNDCEEGIDYSIDFDPNVMNEEQATELASITMHEILRSAQQSMESELAEREEKELKGETDTVETPKVDEVVEVTVD